MKNKLKALAPLFSIGILLIINFIYIPNFFHISITNGVLYGYLIDILNRSSELIILAIGMTFCIAVSRGTDISVGAIMAISGAVLVRMLGTDMTYNMPFILAMIIALLSSLICGLWNGFLVSKLKIQPMIATLILFTAGRGLAQVITGGNNLYVKVDSFGYIGGNIPGVIIPTPIIIAIIVIMIFAILFKKLPLKIFMESTGLNQKASKLVGIKTDKITFISYMVCSLMAGLAGVIATSRISSIDANNVGLNMEMDAILAVAIGGNSLSGGKFSLSGSIIGAILIQTLTTTLYAFKITPDQLPFYKSLIIIAIVFFQSQPVKDFFSNVLKKVKNND